MVCFLDMRRKTVKGVVACEVVGEEQLCIGTSTPEGEESVEPPTAGDITESPAQIANFADSSSKKSRKRKKQKEGGNKPAKRTKH